MADADSQEDLAVLFLEIADELPPLIGIPVRFPMQFAIIANLLARRNNAFLLEYQYLFGTCLRQEHPKVHGFSDHLEEKDDVDFFRNLRLRKETFSHLLNKFKQRYNPQDLGGRKPVSPKTCLYLTLWYLGNRATYREIAELFGISEGAVHHCVHTGVNTICDLGQEYIKWPSHEEAQNTEKHFREISGFPGVVGAIDGCHIEIKAPESVQADFIDRTARHSVNLMAVCDDEKKFIFINAGYPGSAHDSRVFKSTVLYQKVSENPASVFPSGYFHIIGDSAFELSSHVLVPYKDFGNLDRAHRKFNTKLSQTRHVIENAFAFLKGRFRRLKYIDAKINRVPYIIQACCVLHNMTLGFPEEETFLLAEGSLAAEGGSDTGVDVEVIHLPENTSGTEKRNFVASLL